MDFVIKKNIYIKFVIFIFYSTTYFLWLVSLWNSQICNALRGRSLNKNTGTSGLHSGHINSILPWQQQEATTTIRKEMNLKFLSMFQINDISMTKDGSLLLVCDDDRLKSIKLNLTSDNDDSSEKNFDLQSYCSTDGSCGNLNPTLSISVDLSKYNIQSICRRLANDLGISEEQTEGKNPGEYTIVEGAQDSIPTLEKSDSEQTLADDTLTPNENSYDINKDYQEEHSDVISIENPVNEDVDKVKSIIINDMLENSEDGNAAPNDTSEAGDMEDVDKVQYTPDHNDVSNLGGIEDQDNKIETEFNKDNPIESELDNGVPIEPEYSPENVIIEEPEANDQTTIEQETYNIPVVESNEYNLSEEEKGPYSQPEEEQVTQNVAGTEQHTYNLQEENPYLENLPEQNLNAENLQENQYMENPPLENSYEKNPPEVVQEEDITPVTEFDEYSPRTEISRHDTLDDQESTSSEQPKLLLTTDKSHTYTVIVDRGKTRSISCGEKKLEIVSAQLIGTEESMKIAESCIELNFKADCDGLPECLMNFPADKCFKEVDAAHITYKCVE